MTRAIPQAAIGSHRHKLGGLIGADRQRLLAHDVFAGGDGDERVFVVQRIRRADMDDGNRRVAEDLEGLIRRTLDTERARQPLRAVQIQISDGDDIDDADAAKGLGMHSADKAGADDSCPDP
jgi:hypothetical protein